MINIKITKLKVRFVLTNLADLDCMGDFPPREVGIEENFVYARVPSRFAPKGVGVKRKNCVDIKFANYFSNWTRCIDDDGLDVSVFEYSFAKFVLLFASKDFFCVFWLN